MFDRFNKKQLTVVFLAFVALAYIFLKFERVPKAKRSIITQSTFSKFDIALIVLSSLGILYGIVIFFANDGFVSAYDGYY
jgi:sugar phosphate permease